MKTQETWKILFPKNIKDEILKRIDEEWIHEIMDIVRNKQTNGYITDVSRRDELVSDYERIKSLSEENIVDSLDEINELRGIIRQYIKIDFCIRGLHTLEIVLDLTEIEYYELHDCPDREDCN